MTQPFEEPFGYAEALKEVEILARRQEARRLQDARKARDAEFARRLATDYDRQIRLALG